MDHDDGYFGEDVASRYDDDAEIFAQHIVGEFQFQSILAPDKLLAAWLMRELFRSREAEKAAAEAAKIQAA